MRKLLATILVLSFSFVAVAQSQPKHLIAIGNGGLGWSGIGETFDWDKNKSTTKDHERTESELNLNYSYVFDNRVMLGGEIKTKGTKTEQKYTDGEEYSYEETRGEIGVSVGYNFNEDMYNSFWIKGILGSGNTETIEKDTTSNPEKTKIKSRYSYLKIEGGKRFSLDNVFGIKNFSYSPSIAITSYSYDGQIKKDYGLKTAAGAELHILKFDLLF